MKRISCGNKLEVKNKERRSVMFFRKIHILITFVLFMGVAGLSPAEGADYLSAKAFIVIPSLEYEHATPSGLGFSFAVSYLPIEDVRLLSITGGIKKYFKSKPKGFFVAGYPGIWNEDITQTQMFPQYDAQTHRTEFKESEFKGSATFFTLMGTIGWRGAWKHFTVAAELGGGILSVGNIKTSGTDPWTGLRTTSDYGTGGGGLFPVVQLALGYAF